MSRPRFLLTSGLTAMLSLSLALAASAQSPAASAAPASLALSPSAPSLASCAPPATGSMVPASSPGTVASGDLSPSSPAPAAASPETIDPCTSTHVSAQLTEMAISLDVTSLPAGPVTFDITNAGTVDHEFVVIPTDIAVDQLPTKDGAVDEDQVPPLKRAGPIQPGTTTTLSVDLPAGHHVIICNIPGHYLAGMRTELTVS